MNSLLPPNSTALELALEQLIREQFDFGMDLSDVNNADKCPAKFLPWLAWGRSVDTWDNAWTDAQKRSVINASFSVHKSKGTIGAIKAGVGALGYQTTVSEWWQTGRPPYTFRIYIHINQTPVSLEEQKTVINVIESSKNARSGFDLALAVESKNNVQVTTALLVTQTIQVKPL